MKRCLISFSVILVLGFITGCAYLQKPEPPPPLPPIETKVKPPLKLRAEYFKEFPWTELSPPRKDEPEPNSETYTFQKGDTLAGVAEDRMGNKALADKLAAYNDISSTAEVTPGEKIVIPNPIIGVSSRLEIKHKGEKDFGSPVPFDTELKKGEAYKMKFETNAAGYLYVFRRSVKGVDLLYPAKAKTGKKSKQSEPLMRDTGKVEPYSPVEIPLDKKGFAYDAKDRGNDVLVFFSLRKIPDLESLKDKKSIQAADIEAVNIRVNQGEIVSEAPYTMLRITDPTQVLGFTLNLNG
jgi:hypothetical protein